MCLCRYSKNLIITICYRLPSCAIKGLNRFLENIFKKANTENKLCFVAGDFNLNCSDYNKNFEQKFERFTIEFLHMVTFL